MQNTELQKGGSMKRIVLCCILLSFITTGCASITTGRFQKVAVDSNPQNANVTVSSGSHGVTPCSFDLQRNKSHVIKIEKEGYRTAQVDLKKTICGSTAGNIILGGVIGLGVDAMSGAMFKLIPEDVYVDLVPGNPNDIMVINPPKKVETQEQPKKGAEVAHK
ncbi:secreted protein containing PEGA domain protein [Candidatus Omnitrophus magneticus]|uniref:Secreted protein containing PEGA domain protein n=1 Tax=Candidatus Omnitrophus magneticus TaxID=1609969 RepID=A0A0F0CKL6_9BACT|nr:secreted protein containing PEGA domain protein [Candidatus Omnitrophus magneticus]